MNWANMTCVNTALSMNVALSVNAASVLTCKRSTKYIYVEPVFTVCGHFIASCGCEIPSSHIIYVLGSA